MRDTRDTIFFPREKYVEYVSMNGEKDGNNDQQLFINSCIQRGGNSNVLYNLRCENSFYQRLDLGQNLFQTVFLKFLKS